MMHGQQNVKPRSVVSTLPTIAR